VTCTDSNAVVNVDKGQKSYPCPFEGNLEPGTHTVLVSAEGKEQFEQTVAARAGETTNLVVNLRAATPAPADQPEPEPTEQRETPPDPPVTDVETPSAASTGSGLRVAGWASTALGAISAGVGIGFGVKYNSDMEDGEDAQERWENAASGTQEETQALEDYDDIRNNKIPADTAGMIIGYAGAGVFVATGVVLLIIGYGQGEEAQSVAVSPTLSGIQVRF
jgi:hypothetical protein